MSLSYDFSNWTIISLASVAVSLTIGLIMQYAHGQIEYSECVITKQPKLVIINSMCKDFVTPLIDFINQGFKLTLSNNNWLYLTK